jgi:hypothetical protein
MNTEAFYIFAGVSISAVMILSLILERAERRHKRKIQHPLFKRTNEWENLK